MEEFFKEFAVYRGNRSGDTRGHEALSNLRMLEQLLRASFAASSASSSLLPLDCSRSMRRNGLRNMRGGLARVRGRRGRTDARRRGAQRRDASVSLRLPRFATSSYSMYSGCNQCLRLYDRTAADDDIIVAGQRPGGH